MHAVIMHYVSDGCVQSSIRPTLVALFRRAPTAFQVLALIGLRAAKTLVQRNLGIIEANVAHFRAFCKRHSDVMAFTAPAAGSVAFARLLTGEPIDAFCERLVVEAGEDHLLYHRPGYCASLQRCWSRTMAFARVGDIALHSWQVKQSGGL